MLTNLAIKRFVVNLVRVRNLVLEKDLDLILATPQVFLVINVRSY